MERVKKLTKLALTLGVSIILLTNSAFAAGESLGLDGVFGNSSYIGENGSINPTSIIQLIFKALLAVAIVWVVFNIVLAGIRIAGAKDDAEKRKNGLKSIINAAIGLIVALAAFAIVNTLQSTFSGTNAGLPCTINGKLGNVDASGVCQPIDTTK